MKRGRLFRLLHRPDLQKERHAEEGQKDGSDNEARAAVLRLAEGLGPGFFHSGQGWAGLLQFPEGKNLLFGGVRSRT